MTKQLTDPAQETHPIAEATANEEAALQALVDGLLLAALRQRCEHTEEGDELDDALIAAVVQTHLERHPPADAGCPTRGSPPSAAA